MKMGIIGFGVQGSFYARLIEEGKRVEGLEIGAIADTAEEKRNAAREAFPYIPVFDSAESLIRSDKCDFVIIAVPHYAHMAIAEYAIKNSVPVICEKPAGVFALEVRALNETALAHSDVPYGIMLNQRTNPIYKRVHDMVKNGEMGELRHLNWVSRQFRSEQYYASGTWRASWGGEGGGVLVNQAPHPIDLLQWIFGMPVKVYAKCSNQYRNLLVETDVLAFLEFENGANGVFNTCTHDILSEESITAVFDRGRIRIENGSRMTIERLCDSEKSLSSEYGDAKLNQLRRDGALVSIDVMENEPEAYLGCQHAEVLRAFMSHLENKGDMVAQGTDGLNGVVLANAIELSGWMNEPVSLPIDDRLFLQELNRHILEEGKYPAIDLCPEKEA